LTRRGARGTRREMGNVLSDEKKQQVIALGRLGWPLRRIEEETGVRRETSSRYLRAAGIPIRPPRKWGRAKAAKEVITDFDREKSTQSHVAESNAANEVGGDHKGSAISKAAKEAITDSRARPTSACEPYRDLIALEVARGRVAMAIWQDLVTKHGFAATYASVGRFVRKLRVDADKEPRAIIFTAPGEEMQVDYGEGPMVREPSSGKYRRPRLFLLTLGCSRKSVRLLTWRSSAKTWCELHERAFRRLGGVACVCVLDNLREGVVTPDIYEPRLNPLYKDMLAHYGVVALPCRVRDPDRKGKVESGIGHTQKMLRGLRFESIEEAQKHLDAWDARWADTRIHGTMKKQVAAMFAEEKPYLLTLPVEPFRYYKHGTRTVHLDGHIEVDGAYYSAPPGSIGRVVSVQWDEKRVRILDAKTGALLREHAPQLRGRHRTRDEDKPKKMPATTEQLLARARAAGKRIGAVAQAIHQLDGELGVRRIVGLLALAKKHGVVTTDDACGLALDVGVPTYRFVRQYIDRKDTPQISLTQIDPLIRDLTHYRDLIARITEKESV
jgi:transposase